jgi:hypothetical protein
MILGIAAASAVLVAVAIAAASAVLVAVAIADTAGEGDRAPSRVA